MQLPASPPLLSLSLFSVVLVLEPRELSRAPHVLRCQKEGELPLSSLVDDGFTNKDTRLAGKTAILTNDSAALFANSTNADDC